MKKNPINLLQALNDNYMNKQNQFLKMLSEMETLAIAQLQEAEDDFVKHMTNAMLETVRSIGKAYIQIYQAKQVKNFQVDETEKVADGNA